MRPAPRRQSVDLLRWDRAAARLWCDLAQLSILASLFGLYLVAPRPADAAAANPIPYVLALFTFATLVRLILDLRQVTLPGLQYVWVVVDFACLYGLLVSYHVQYGQPASISLKATTSDMIFLLIAVRAILFNERVVLAAGAVAALGWLALSAYAVATAGPNAITHSFVAYMTSDGILVGAQVERIAAILLVSLVIAVAVRRSRRDALTRLGNRAWFLMRMEVLARARKKKWAVCLIEIRDLHLVANTFGAGFQERVLRIAASRLRTAAKSRAAVAYFGGTTFAVLETSVRGPDDSTQLGRTLADALAAPVDLDGTRLSIRVSAGVALGNRLESPADTLANAQAALNRAKADATFGVTLFKQRFRREAALALTVETELRNALKNGELALHYQPIVRLKDRRTIGAEALLRWTSPTRGPVPPDLFVPVAEASGLIVDIGAWVIEQAVEDRRRWLDATGRRDLFVSVNVAAAQLVEWDTLLRTIERVGAAEANLKIELTESAFGDHPDAAASRLKRLSELGCSIVLDDFGTGYSSYGRLRELPFETLKIDRSFTAQVADPAGAAVLSSILTLSNGLGLTAIAEGVETDAQRRALLRLGCSVGQGYAFGRAMPGEALVAKVRSEALFPARAARAQHPAQDGDRDMAAVVRC